MGSSATGGLALGAFGPCAGSSTLACIAPMSFSDSRYLASGDSDGVASKPIDGVMTRVPKRFADGGCLRVVIPVRVGDQETADRAEVVSQRSQRLPEQRLRGIQSAAGDDEHQLFPFDDGVHVDGVQPVVGQRKRDAKDARRDLERARPLPGIAILRCHRRRLACRGHAVARNEAIAISLAALRDTFPTCVIGSSGTVIRYSGQLTLATPAVSSLCVTEARATPSALVTTRAATRSPSSRSGTGTTQTASIRSSARSAISTSAIEMLRPPRM